MQERRLELERVLPAERPVVFAAFTEPSVLAKWWGPQGFSVPEMDFAPLPAGRYGIKMQPPEGEPFWLTGEFREVEPPLLLSYTFVWVPPDPDDVETVVVLSFTERGGSTSVALVQSDFKTDERLELHRAGWTESFDKLEALLA